MKLNKIVSEVVEEVVAKKVRMKKKKKSRIVKLWENWVEKHKRANKLKPNVYVNFIKKYAKRAGDTKLIIAYIKRKIGLKYAHAKKRGNKKLMGMYKKIRKQVDQVSARMIKKVLKPAK